MVGKKRKNGVTRTTKLSEAAKNEVYYALDSVDDLNKEHEWHLNRTVLSNIKKYLRGLLEGKIKDSGNINWWNENSYYEFLEIIEDEGYFNPKDWLSDKQIRKLGIKETKKKSRN